MALIIGTNSFVTLTEANNYLDSKFGAGGWSALPDATKEQLLVTAFRWLVSLGIAKTSTDENIKWAQIELAWWSYNYLSEYEDRGALLASGVTKFQLSKWEEELSSQGLPTIVKDLIADAINVGGFFPTMSRELEN